MKILVLNAGSSSVKFQLFDMNNASVIAGGLIEKIGEEYSGFVYRKFEGDQEVKKIKEDRAIKDHQTGLELIAKSLLDIENGAIQSNEEIHAVGHRVVHGGEKFSQPTIVSDEIVQELKALSFLAPLHNPANLNGIEVATNVFPKAVQVAVFDTAFHQTLPDYAYRFSIPKSFYEAHGLRAYGFHGTSHAYVSRTAAKFLNMESKTFNAITIHLGNGCSMAAIRNGKSVDVSMGLTPVGGLIMGTRSGDIDPGLLLFLMDHLHMSSQEIDRLLNKESGLKGLAGDNDLRNVLAKYDDGDPDAVLAVTMYIYRIKKFIGSYVAALGRVDAVIFTAGVGENSAAIRALVCENLGILGIELDEGKNEVRSPDPRVISSEKSAINVLVVPTNEELEIAMQTKEIV
ncbi:MAG: acetate kinase [Bacteroidota bacterium]